MIKAVGRTGDGKPLLFLGLDDENVARLTAGQPILLDLADVGMPTTKVVLVHGPTNKAITALLAHHGLLDPTPAAPPAEEHRAAADPVRPPVLPPPPANPKWN